MTNIGHIQCLMVLWTIGWLLVIHRQCMLISMVSCNADYAGCLVTRRSHSGILIFIQGAPVIWYSKRQNTAESAVFRSEFIALEIAVEQIEGLRYKLCMMGDPIDGPADVYCDSKSVFKNAAFPESTLKKKHNAISYQKAREAQAAGIIRLAWEKRRYQLGRCAYKDISWTSPAIT
jgi:hypothetical protein